MRSKDGTSIRFKVGPGVAARRLRTVNDILVSRYGTPRLGNLKHPISELVFIILSVRTRGKNHEATYRELRRRFPNWESVRDAPLVELEAVLHDSGLGRVKARQIQGTLRRLTTDLGSLSGRHLSRIATQDLEDYLCSLPGVALKTGRCVMMYSLARPVFPVDTHCLRLFQNLGLVEGRPRIDAAQNPFQDLVPWGIRYTLHVNTVAHGRLTCIPRSERCFNCPISSHCRNRKEGRARGVDASLGSVLGIIES